MTYIGTSSPKRTKRIARSACITGRARCVNVLTKALGGFGRTGNIRITRVVRNKSRFLDKLKDSRVIPSVARTCHFSTAVQNVLDGQVNVFSLSFSSNLDAIGHTRNSAMRPTAAAVYKKSTCRRRRRRPLLFEWLYYGCETTNKTRPAPSQVQHVSDRSSFIATYIEEDAGWAIWWGNWHHWRHSTKRPQEEYPRRCRCEVDQEGSHCTLYAQVDANIILYSTEH